MLNPEFRRYLWTELSPHKLVAMPVVLGAAVYLLDTTGFRSGIATVAQAAFMVIAFLWGTRRAAAAVVEEVRGGTWDSQRMSALEAWPMAWAKLFGSTIFTWYGAFICLGVFVGVSLADSGSEPVVRYAVGLVLVAMLMHAVALGASLAFHRKSQGVRQVSVTLCHLIGLGVLALDRLFIRLLTGPPTPSDPLTYWHGYQFGGFDFALATLVAFYGWALLGVHRLMRAELQHRALPWGWAAFTVFLFVYAGGFADDRSSGLTLGRAGVGFAVAAAMAYVVFLLENKSFVTAKAWAEALRTGRWKTMALLTPSWFVCMWLAIAAGVGLAVLAEVTEASGVARYLAPKAYLTGPFVIAAILFMLRDIGFLLFLNLGTRLLRPDLAGVIYLIVLYGVGGGLLSQFNYGGALAFVVPNDTGNAILTIAPVLVQAAVVWAVLAYRLRSTMRAAAPAN